MAMHVALRELAASEDLWFGCSRMRMARMHSPLARMAVIALRWPCSDERSRAPNTASTSLNGWRDSAIPSVSAPPPGAPWPTTGLAALEPTGAIIAFSAKRAAVTSLSVGLALASAALIVGVRLVSCVSNRSRTSDRRAEWNSGGNIAFCNMRRAPTV